MMMDPTRFRIQVVTRAATSASVVVPALAGASALLLGIVLGQPVGWLTFLGAMGLLVAGGMTATRLILWTDDLARSVYETSVENAQEEHEDYLKRLARQLRRDRDDRTGESVSRLRKLHNRLRQDGFLSGKAESVVLLEIREKIDQLYWSCLRSLERSLVMWRAANEMSTPDTRQAMLQRREQLVAEVQSGIAHLETTVDQLLAKQLRQGDEMDMVRVRDELETGLQVARRVEERMTELENDLGTRVVGQAVPDES